MCIERERERRAYTTVYPSMSTAHQFFFGASCRIPTSLQIAKASRAKIGRKGTIDQIVWSHAFAVEPHKSEQPQHADHPEVAHVTRV